MKSTSVPALLALLSVLTLAPDRLLAWGEPHHAITRAALEVLPVWQKELLGTELAALADSYCLIPDNVYTDKANAKFAQMDSHPGEVYLKKLHLPEPDQAVNLETIRWFMGKAVASLKAGQPGDAARYMGTVCHLIEDFGSPSHTIPGDNQFTLLQQFLPPTENMRDKLLHGPVENGTFAVSISGHAPRLLGVTVEEASWRLLHRVHEGIINARSTTIPIIQALYAGDDEARVRHQMRAAVLEAQIVADAMFTILCLGAGKFDDEASKPLGTVGIAAFWPLEAVNLHYPQSHFFGSPYWGHATHGHVLEGGTKRAPFRLRIAHESGMVEKEFADGISAGAGKPLSWVLPQGVYRQFAAKIGLQAGVGDKGRVEFTVLGDGKALVSATVNGTDPAQEIHCDITGVTRLQLSTTSRGLDAKNNYALWIEPVLKKS